MTHKKTPITSCIMDTKHQDTKRKGQSIHKNKLNPIMTHKIHTTQMKINIEHIKNLRPTWNHCMDEFSTFYSPLNLDIELISSSSIV